MADSSKNSALWRIITAQFECSAPTIAACPSGELPEIAVIGRSNVGKSSLLNAFSGRRGLARVSRTPGRTQLLNFFCMTLRHPILGERKFRWVDLPGYGFAFAPQHVQASFGPMIEGYLSKRSNLRGLLLLIDGRKGVSEDDRNALLFANHVCKVPVVIVMTKTDKLNKSERGLLVVNIAKQLALSQAQIVLTSVHSGLGFQPQGAKDTLLVHALERLMFVDGV